MSTAAKKVAIIGAGLKGLACAIALEKQGIRPREGIDYAFIVWWRLRDPQAIRSEA